MYSGQLPIIIGETILIDAGAPMLNSRNAVAVCAGAGLLLGAVSALVGGFLYGTGMLFEFIIYLFVGVVLGTVFGGLFGAVLASRLPDSSSEVTSEQVMGGVMRVIGGFFVLGIGAMSFAVFNDMERRGSSGPSRMWAIPMALYDVLGKWGMLLIMAGFGITLIVLGVKAMIPAPAPPKRSRKRKKRPRRQLPGADI